MLNIDEMRDFAMLCRESVEYEGIGGGVFVDADIVLKLINHLWDTIGELEKMRCCATCIYENWEDNDGEYRCGKHWRKTDGRDDGCGDWAWEEQNTNSK